jgi:signal transduction histidine kinase
MVIGLALVLVSIGTVLFVRLTSPIVRHLTETEQRYQRLFSSAPVPIWDQDCSGVVKALQALRQSGITSLETYLAENPEAVSHLVSEVRIKEANAAALQCFAAHSDAEFMIWFEQHFVPTACKGTAAELLQALWAGHEALLTRTLSIRALDGRDLTVLVSMVIPNAGNGYRSVPVAALDITADLKLSRREEELDLILASTGEGIYGMDNAGSCNFINRAALLMLGFPDEDTLLGRDMHALIHPDCLDGGASPADACPIYRACRQNAVVLLDDVELMRADHMRFSAAYRSYPMLRDGARVGTVVTFNDITERKERDAQHLHAQKMEVMGQLTGGIAHDFNNLLAIILTNLRMLAEQFAGKVDADTRELMDDTLSAAEDGAELTARLLTFSRRDARKQHLAEINTLLADYHKFLSSVKGDAIELVIRRAEQPLSVVIDTQELANAILNLAINARDAMPEGGTLSIEVRRQHVDQTVPLSQLHLASGAYVVICVTDTGAGMPPEIVRRAVEPFFTTKPAGKGSGLGLSMVFRFAQQIGGGLRIESAPGQGTRVSLYLPEAPPVPNDRDEPLASRIPAGSRQPTARVLLVEDEPRMRRLAARMLTELGYQVLEAEDAAEAVRILERDLGIDLLFTDIAMPGELNGRDLGYWARRHRPGLKVLLTSGQFQTAPAAEIPGGEILPFISKPYAKEPLQQAIQSLLDLH